PAERKKISSGKVWCYEGDLKGDLGDEDFGFLSGLPESVITSAPGVGCLFSHYIYPDFTGSTTRYVERNFQLKELWKFMEENKVCFSFSGHSHTTHTGFAYKGNGNRVRAYLKAFHSIPSERFYMGGDPMIVMLPPLTGEDGKTGFAVFDTGQIELSIVSLR
ncbi:MAG: hypothetical protein MUE74_11495, partial [Bacteroidales bacterium]|nr:hypothetical protein [Bacteroidales bacterium]